MDEHRVRVTHTDGSKNELLHDPCAPGYDPCKIDGCGQEVLWASEALELCGVHMVEFIVRALKVGARVEYVKC